MVTEPLATAETAATGGDTPPAAAETKTETAPKPEEVLAGDNIEAIRALMRENGNALLQKGAESPWQGFDDSQPDGETPPDADPDPNATATPGEGEGEAAAGDTTGKPATEQAQPPAKTDTTKPINRVRISLFPEGDQAIIQRMAEKKGLTIDQARQELIAEGKLPKAEASAAAPLKTDAAAPPPKDETADAITTQQGKITELETQIKTAAKAFDSEKVADLQIEHNKALAQLGKLETKAEARQSQARQQAQATHAEQVTHSETSAVELFPDAATPGTPLHDAIEDLMDAAPAEAFRDPDYPLKFAAKAAAQIKYKPAAPKAAVAVVPKKPARPVPPAPASGHAGAAAVTRGPTVEAQIAEAEKTGDVATLKDLLRQHGTRSLE